MTNDFLDSLPGRHDLTLPDWGPYSKRFFGISHLADKRYGHRFDFTVMPGYYRRQLGVPDALRPAGYTPWDASTDLEDYSYRQQIEWKDQAYADISFSRIDEHLRLVRCELVNHTGIEADFALHLVSALVLNPAEQCRRPEDGWIDALERDEVVFAKPRLRDGLEQDGFLRGEVRDPSAIGGSFIAFGQDAGDRVCFTLPQSSMTLFARLRAKAPVKVLCGGKTVSIPSAPDWQWVELGTIEGTDLEMVSLGSEQNIELDGLSVAPFESASLPSDAVPRVKHDPGSNFVLISYGGIDQSYALWWDFDSEFVRHYAAGDFNRILLYDDGIHQEFIRGYDRHGGKDHQLDTVLQPLPVKPGERRVHYALIGDGQMDQLAGKFERMDKAPQTLEAIYQARRKRYFALPEAPAKFGIERMAAVTLTNVVYPTYTQKSYIRHHTPGRRWNCLYTWDSGFIGLGMLEFDLTRAVENLNAYLTGPGDRENAFIHHGSPVPVQLYLFFEIINRTGDRELLCRFYPRVRQYYMFLSGHHPASRTRSHSREPMICTWDYFYNSGGWDDYPPQWEVHTTGKHHIIPTVGTSHAIRCAKMLQACARELDFDDDVLLYEKDIREFTESLQRYAWDDQAGYFSYVEHDANGAPSGIFRHEASGQNFNMGLDGASALIAGAATARQRQILWSKLQSDEHCWSRAGLSTVDQSAAYYRANGYWNGSVWMPHQYFFWKSALDDGQSDFAWRIASTALELWEKECRASYNCYEHFAISSSRGSGWHHFSALSAPVLCWFAAYYLPEHMTSGFEVRRRMVHFSPDGVTADLVIGGEAGRSSTLIVTLPGGKYEATYDETKIPVRERVPGAFEVMLPQASRGTFALRIRR